MGLAAFLAGCSDKITVNSPSNLQPEPNRAPRIVAQGPNWSSSPIDVGRAGSPEPYVMVADDNGIGDIAGAFFSIETAIVHRFISRPDSIPPGGFYCTLVSYSDTVDIRALVPATFARVIENCPMFRGTSAANYFSTSAFSPYGLFGGAPCSALPRIDLSSPYFGTPVARCGPQLYEVFSRFGVYPPAVPAAFDVSITYLDVEFRGLRATVYDAAGASAVAIFPDLRLIYMTPSEREFAP